MKRIVCICVIVITCFLLLVGCSEGAYYKDDNPKDLYAIITLPNGDIVEGDIEKYHRYNEACFEVHIEGNAYFVHPTKVAFISNYHQNEKCGDAE